MGVPVIQDEQTSGTNPIRLNPDQLVAASRLAKGLGRYLDRAKEEPLFVTRGPGIEVVMMNIEHYRDLLERLEDAYLTALLLQRKEEARRTGSKSVSLDEAMREFGLNPETGEPIDADGDVDG